MLLSHSLPQNKSITVYLAHCMNTAIGLVDLFLFISDVLVESVYRSTDCQLAVLRERNAGRTATTLVVFKLMVSTAYMFNLVFMWSFVFLVIVSGITPFFFLCKKRKNILHQNMQLMTDALPIGYSLRISVVSL